MSNTVGIIDEPVQPGEKDSLDIGRHATALSKFIASTTTPITIGIQGEWGSGKTSLINSIYHYFENKEKYKQIWINSWESSLLSTPEESLLKIINEIIEELLTADENKSKAEQIKKSASTVFKGALRIGASAALGLKAGEVAEELLSSKENSIKSLRNQLTNLVLEIGERKTNSFEKVIVYVDDLDRIEPKNAVAVLELLKNIFSIPHCIFILAIDYQVVVKGLEHKFGKQTAQNEWEFRAFFDKIIQLPFMMPMGQYNIGKYVNNLLTKIGFVQEPGLNEEAIKEIILRTIGGNPRSIKRLVNSVSLIQIFSNLDDQQQNLDGIENQDTEISNEQKKFLLFSLLCLQIAYPQIYSILNSNPNFIDWNDDLAFSETKKREESEPDFNTEFENAKKTDDFDEDWEKALFRICYVKPRLKARVSDISKFFSYIKDEFLNDQNDLIKETIIEVLNQTSVTNVTSTDQPQIIFPERQGAYKRRYLNDFEHWLADKKNSDRRFTEEFTNLAMNLHDDLKLTFKDSEFIFAGGVSMYINKHKFLAFFQKKDFMSLEVLRHFEDEYRIPIIGSLKAVCCREYKKGKFSTAHNGNRFILPITPEIYKKEKQGIILALKKSYDIAKNHWDKKLVVECSKGLFATNEFEIKDNIEEAEDAALKFLNNNYTYVLK